MTEFQIGDIVRLTKGEPDAPGHGAWVLVVTSGDLSAGTISLCALRAFEDAGGKIELIERTASPLPTTPNTLGWATVDGVRSLARLAAGRWELYDTNGSLGAIPHPSAIEDFTEAVLIPKKLAEQITAWAGGGAVDADRILNDLAAHLKGQDDE